MHKLVPVLFLLFLVQFAVAEGEGGNPLRFKDSRYPVQLNGPKGWKKTLSEPAPVGSWVDLVRYQEEKSGALVQLSVQATTYRSSEEMIQGLSDQFQKSSSLAILRQEIQAETPRRPRGILFEYSQRGSAGQEHKIAAYWFHNGRRYRVYGTVKEIGWKAVGSDIEGVAKSVEFTSREFGKSLQNFTDVEKNYAIYFADGWTLKLPGAGPRVEFESLKLGATVTVWVTKEAGNLAAAAASTRREIEKLGVQGLAQAGPRRHPDTGFDILTFDYKRMIDKTPYTFRETLAVHGGMLYRVVLGAGDKTFAAATEVYDRMVGSLAFIR